MEAKHKELALKMLEVCKGYKPIEALEALGNLYCVFIGTQLKNPTARILAYSEFIKRLNDEISETSIEILSETTNND